MCRASLLLAFVILAAATAAPAQTPEVQADVNKILALLRELQGTWTTETVVADGKEVAKEDFKDEVLVITDNKFQSKRGDKVLLQGDFKVDPTKAPLHLDLTLPKGDSQETLLAVYSLKQDVLTLCFATGGKDRPTELKPGAGRHFRIFKRQKPSEDKAEMMAATIDRGLNALWKKLKLQPAPLAGDAEFLRRVYLDLAGRIPSVGEAREFLQDTRLDKRRRLIDHLTSQPAFPKQVARLMREFLLPEVPQELDTPTIQMAFESWLLDKLKQRKGLDEIARTMLTAGGGGRNRRLTEFQGDQGTGETIFTTVNEGKPERLAGSTARVMLGVRLECAQCHNHPFASWKQEQFWQFAAFFGNAGRPPRLRVPGKQGVATPHFLDGSEPNWEQTTNARQALAQWVTSPQNARFARNAVQRVWQHFHGVGLIDDTCDVPDANDQNGLLDELAAQFVASGFDMLTLARGIVLSKAYQLSSRGNESPTSSIRHFVHHTIKSMAPEQFFDSIAQATGITTLNYPRYNADRAAFLTKFLHAPDQRTEHQTSILQALFLMNGSFAADATSPERGATLAAVTDAPFFSTSERIDILFLATLTRYPTESERTRLVAYVDSGGTQKDSKRALADVFWALLNSGEFLLHR